MLSNRCSVENDRRLSDLLREAQRLAAREGVTLKALIERRLHRVISETKPVPGKLRRGSFKGNGLHPDLQHASWDRIRDLIYDGRTATGRRRCNILVYAHREVGRFTAASPCAHRARPKARRTWAIPWPCLHEFLSIVTHPRIYATPTPLTRALKQIDNLARIANPVAPGESATHWSTLRALLARSRRHDRVSMTGRSQPFAVNTVFAVWIG